MGPDDQMWLYRQGDLTLGPVPSKQIIDKLFSGELTGAAEVRTVDMGAFVRVADVPDFKVHLAKASAQHRVTAEHQAHQATQRKQRTRSVAVLVGVLSAVGIGVAVLGSYLAVHTSTRSAEELAWGDITIDAPTITRARRSVDDELVDYQGPNGKRPAPTVAQPGPTRPQPGPTPGPTGPVAPRDPKPKMGQADSEGLAMGEIDQDGINAIIAQKKPSLIPCIKEVAKPGMPATKIPIEFSIAEGGKVGKVWVDNPDFKGGPLTECLLKELQKWPFKTSHAGATVNLSFNIGKRG